MYLPGGKTAPFNAFEPEKMYLLCTRKLGGTIDVIGGQAGTIRRVEGRRRDKHASEENPIQVNVLSCLENFLIFTAFSVNPDKSLCFPDLPYNCSHLQSSR